MLLKDIKLWPVVLWALIDIPYLVGRQPQRRAATVALGAQLLEPTVSTPFVSAHRGHENPCIQIRAAI